MIDAELTHQFFLESDSDQLRKIHQWGRARYAAPWAVFFAVLLRVAASIPPHVQLPGVIGGRASLNLLCAFVSPSGGGKGISDKVGRLAWPTPILELPIGSGEGIAETFTLRGKESEDNERVTAAIFSCPEVDILTGLESRQGSTILGTLKAFAMGEQFGSTNASKANSRNVHAHSYRGCLSVGAQPGHTGVIFNDVTGGTPQRFLWALTIDPDMPATVTPDPEPLDTELPLWVPNNDGVVELHYGHADIRETIIAAHLARQRGEADALDGHAMLTRLKVAAVIAIMHGRSVVSEWDWQRSAEVMAVSDSTRDWIVSEARRAARAKARERAMTRAAGEDFYDASRLETVKRSIMRMLERDGEQQGNVLRSRLGRKEKRELFDQAVALLEADGLVSSIPGLQKGLRYRIGGQGDHNGQGGFTQFRDPDQVGQGDHHGTVNGLDSRSSVGSGRPKLSARQWLQEYVAELREEGRTTVAASEVLDAGEAAGHTRGSLTTARTKIKGITVADRSSDNSVWSIVPGAAPTYVSAAGWVASYLDSLPVETEFIDRDHLYAAAAVAKHSQIAVRNALNVSDRVDSVPPPSGSQSRRDRIWRIRREEFAS